MGWHSDEIARVVSISNERGNKNIYLIDTKPLQYLFKVDIPTQAACDGFHPNGYGNAILGGFIAVEAQKNINNH